MEISPRITVNPGQCGGRPCIRGMRIRVTDVLDLLAAGLSKERILGEIPDLEMEDINAVLQFAPLKRKAHTRFCSILLLVIATATVVFTQETKKQLNVADFSGRWVSKKVYVATNPILALPKGASNLKIELLIIQSGDELRVKEMTSGNGSFSRELVYYLDRRGETNKGFTEGITYASKTTLKSRKILINSIVRFANTKDTSTLREEWVLSADGKTLTVRTENMPKNHVIELNTSVRYEKIFRLAS